MRAPKPNTVDFETGPIEQRPAYPPVPVGVSIKLWGKKARYYAWGHPTKNNCTKAEAIKALKQVWAGDLLFHNGKFDLDVAETHLGLTRPAWQQVHDTTFLLFLDDPHQREIGLKPGAERLLGMPSEERDEVVDWLIANQPVKGIKLTKARYGKNPYAGAYVAYAPGDLVGRYADGDTSRTEGLFKLLWAKTCIERKMLAAYDRERELMYYLLDSERDGVRIDLDRLWADVKLYQGWEAKLTAWVVKRLGITDPDFNLDSGSQLVAALEAAGKVDLAKLGTTAKGAPSTNKDAIKAGVTDKVLGAVLQYRTQLRTCLHTFLETWLKMAEASGGYIYTNWNQVKGDQGTRTGRLSSTPNFQNIPKEFGAIFQDAEHKDLPKCPWADLPPLPLCRGYVVPYADDEILLDRDFSQQEPRILAHFEDGQLMAQYQANPWIDYHDNAKDHLERILGRKFERKPVKNINLGIIYGMGLGSLAERNGSTVEETKRLRDAIYGLYPGLKTMYQEMKALYVANQPIRTWGCREYFCEPPKIVNGRLMHFDYKMVNLLIQGSAADCTKEAVIRFARELRRLGKVGVWRILLQVHDEILISAPKADAAQAMEVLRVCMESVEFDVKILSEGTWSAVNWSSLRDYDKKGKIIDVFDQSSSGPGPRRQAGAKPADKLVVQPVQRVSRVPAQVPAQVHRQAAGTVVARARAR